MTGFDTDLMCVLAEMTRKDSVRLQISFPDALRQHMADAGKALTNSRVLTGVTGPDASSTFTLPGGMNLAEAGRYLSKLLRLYNDSEADLRDEGNDPQVDDIMTRMFEGLRFKVTESFCDFSGLRTL